MNKDLNRRDFLKSLGAGAVATSALLSACKGKNGDLHAEGSYQEPPVGKMTYRKNPKTGDKVSILGYGMMRLPVKGGGTGRENPDAELDQDMINKQIDYALIGGEGNGGVIYPAIHSGRDAMVGVALFLSNLAHKKMKVSELKRTYPEYHIAKNRIELSDKSMIDKILTELKKIYANENVNDIDGVKISFESKREWVHLRKSNTEPIIRIYSEAPTEEEAVKLGEEVIKVAEKIIEGK